MTLCNYALALVLAISALPFGVAPDDAAKSPEPKPRNLAIFVFEGVQIIDYTGPYEVFGQAYDGNAHMKMFDVYTVAEKPGPLTTAMGMTIVPKYTFADAPKADVLVLPGGGVNRHLEKPEVIAWVRASAANAEHVLSVCNGAFYLGKAGLLDGLTATTFYGLLDQLQALAPKCRVVDDQRFVDNGKIVTTAGLSSGIDGALHIVEKIAGRGKAQEIALNLEYNWQPDAGYARASLADAPLRRALGHDGIDLPDSVAWSVVGQEGDRTRWTKRWELRGEIAPEAIAKAVDDRLSKSWTRESREGNAARWRFVDDGGHAWRADSSVTGSKGVYRIEISLAREEARAAAQKGE
jgi:putative intracellular protease/amidase